MITETQDEFLGRINNILGEVAMTDLIICPECGEPIKPNEYHPYAFCLLNRAGLDPWREINKAVAARDGGQFDDPA